MPSTTIITVLNSLYAIYLLWMGIACAVAYHHTKRVAYLWMSNPPIGVSIVWALTLLMGWDRITMATFPFIIMTIPCNGFIWFIQHESKKDYPPGSDIFLLQRPALPIQPSKPHPVIMPLSLMSMATLVFLLMPGFQAGGPLPCSWGDLALRRSACQGTFATTSTDIDALAASPDGSVVAAAGFHEISLWTSGGQHIRTIPTESIINAIAFSPDGKLMSVTEAYGATSIWSVADGVLIHSADTESHRGNAQFTPDSQQIVLGSDSDTITIRRISDGSITTRLSAPVRGLNTVAISPDGTQVAAASRKEGQIYLWSVASPSTPRPLVSEGLGRGDKIQIAFAPQGHTLAVAHNRTIQLWDMASGTLVRQMSWDASNSEFERGYEPTKISFSPDGSAIAAIYHDRSIRVWQPETDQRQIIHYSGIVGDIAFGGQPWALLSGGWDGLIQRWDIGRGAAQ